MQYCPHCMRPATGAKCPHCGGDVSWTGKNGIDLPVGTVLTGGGGLRTYRIGAARGMGGFGITYIALELNSNRRTAVKEYFPTRCALRGGDGISVQTMTGQESMFKGGMNSFLDEARMLLAQDDLPSVVRVIDYFQANGTAYLAMEYLDGVPLHTQMTRMGGRIPVSELMPRLVPLLRDIGQLHRRGVIHRDISPDNIMWMPDGGLKLLDFGSARAMENGRTMTVLMKQGFSPIEQYRSKGQGPYTDIYALAATICYCVTGVIPPSALDRLDDDPLQSPIALGAALTVRQEAALLWALSLQPNARPQSMEEFAGMLFKEGPEPRTEPLFKTEPAPVGAGFPIHIEGETAQRPQPQPVRVRQEPPGTEPAAAVGTQFGPPDRPAEDVPNSLPPDGKDEAVLPGRLGQWLQTRGISGRTAMKVITAAVVIMAVYMAYLAVDAVRSILEMRQIYGRLLRFIALDGAYFARMLLHMAGGTGFAVCAALLIALRKKTAPYIGAVTSLAVLLPSAIIALAISGALVYDQAVFFTVFFYVVIALAAAAVTLYWLAHCEPGRLRETCGKAAITAAVTVSAAFMAIYAMQAWLEIYVMRLGW